MRVTLFGIACALAMALIHSPAAAEGFDYRADQLPDPFEPWSVPDAIEQGLHPWEKVYLDEIRIVGIIGGVRDATARIQVDGDYFNIRVGMRLGRERARIVRIADDTIYLQVSSQVDGKPVLQERRLKL